MNDRDIKLDLKRSETPDIYKAGDIVRVHGSYGPEYCSRADGTGSSWSVVKGTEWYLVEVSEAWGTLSLDDRNRPELDGEPAFTATVSKINVEPIEKEQE